MLTRASTEPVTGALADAGLAIYVHWPFCAAKCPYCDFNSHVRHGGVDQPRFAGALVRELTWFSEQETAGPAVSVFFGGGTPSLMEPATVASILEAIDRLWGLAAGAEITLEANPTSVEVARFAGYRVAGVNRVSLGVQALDDAALTRLGRQHTTKEALDAFAIARTTFERVSFDLIYARPGQTIDGWRSELTRALAHAVDHLSLYQLTIEPGTRFFDLERAGRLAVPPDDHAAALYEITQDICDDHGLPAYEISNHARPGAECRHNLIYWQAGRWVGVGPGAHGRIGRSEASTRRATVAESSPEVWLGLVEARGYGLSEQRPIETDEAADELLLMGLRTSEGVDLDRYRRVGGQIDPERLEALVSDGVVTRDADRLRLTAAGRLLANAVIAELAGG